MKNYSEFIEYVKANVTDYLPERFEDARINVWQVVKINDVVQEGLTILDPDTRNAPAVYLNSLYDQYLDGKDLDDIVADIADTYIEHIESVHDRTFQTIVENLDNYEKIKDYIFPKLINLEKSRLYLTDAPHTQKEDLAVTYNVKITGDSDSISSLLITNSMLNTYGLTIEELHEKAVENMERLSPAVCISLMDAAEAVIADGLSEREGLSDEEAREHAGEIISISGIEMYCLTNRLRINGAASIISENVQQMLADQVGGDYYVLPSSVHEVIIVPKRMNISPRELTDMVNAVNAKLVLEDEYLSDNIYQYDAKEHKFSMCIPERNLKENRALESEPVIDMQEEKNTLRPELPEKNQEPMKHSGKIH